MKIDCLKISECHSSEKLMELYNTWQEETQFLSTGNCETKSWQDLIEYGKEHIMESIDFALEYLNDKGSNWIILTFVNEAIGDPIDRKNTTGYINPNTNEIKEFYIYYLTLKHLSYGRE